MPAGRLVGITFKTPVETGEGEPWEIKDLRKSWATCHDKHTPESSIEILEGVLLLKVEVAAASTQPIAAN